MKPVTFAEQNVVFAENQEPYLPLPAYQNGNSIVHCWQLSWSERIKVLLGNKLWIHVLTFKQPPQPIRPMLNNPFKMMKGDRLPEQSP